MKRSMTFFHFVAVAMIVCTMVLSSVSPATSEEAAPEWEYGTVTSQLRYYYFTQRDKDQWTDVKHVKESLALGGFLKYETPWLKDMFQAGVAGYASVPFPSHFNRPAKGGTQLLTSRNDSIAVIGEAFLKGRHEKTVATLYRQRLSTPMVNVSDSRMIPLLFEAYSVESKDIDNLRLQVGWVDKIKNRDTDVFKYMTAVSKNSAVDDAKRGMFMVGGDWTPEFMKSRSWYYAIPDYLQMTFLEAQSEYELSDTLSVRWLAQGLDQRSQGGQDGGSFNVVEFGLLGGVTWHGVKLGLGGSIVDNTTDVVSRWGSNPFFSDMMSYSNNRAGEKTLYMEAGYDFSRIGWDGFTSSVHTSFGRTPNIGRNKSPDQNEYDLKMNYVFDGKLKGLTIINFWSYQEGKGSQDGSDGMQVRLRFQYDFQLL